MTKISVKKLSLIALLTFAAGSVGLAHGTKNTPNHAVIEFQKGQDQLTQTSRDSLMRLVDNAKMQGQIATIEVAVWSDEPFPARNQDLSAADRALADSRGDQIETYLKSTLNISSVKTFNMAEGSNWLSRAFNTDSAELKSVFSKEESPALTRRDFNIVREEGAPSKAVLVVTMEKTNLTPVTPLNDANKTNY